MNNAIYFENGIANNTWTLPSHITMFTGLYSTQIKLVSKFIHKLSSKLPVLTEIIRDLGYYTICYTENPWINQFFKLTRGFSSYFTNFRKTFEILEDYKFIQITNSILKKIDTLLINRLNIKTLMRSWQKVKAQIKYLIEMIIKFISWKRWLLDSKDTPKILNKFGLFLKKRIREKPFYLFFNIMASHFPYIPIKEALNYCNFQDRDFKYLKYFLIDIKRIFHRVNIKSKPLSKKQQLILNRLYNSSIYYNDMIIGKIFNILESLNLLENSYIIITSDHGECLSNQEDHFFYGHGVDQSAHEALIKVPLIIWNSNFKKRIIKDQVELKDLFHTILHLTGFPINKNKYLDIKKSILFQIRNRSTPKYIYGEHLKEKREMNTTIIKYRKFIKRDQITKIMNNLYFLRTNRYKYIDFENKIEEIYDLINDPLERFNIINSNTEIYREMKSYMQNIKKKIKDINKLKVLVTEREKDILNKAINKIKINF